MWPGLYALCGLCVNSCAPPPVLQIMSSVRQFILANESEPHGVVLIMADMDKEEMDLKLHTEIPNWKTTKIITRSGNPIHIKDLERCSVSRAKSVVVRACEPPVPTRSAVNILVVADSFAGR